MSAVASRVASDEELVRAAVKASLEELRWRRAEAVRRLGRLRLLEQEHRWISCLVSVARDLTRDYRVGPAVANQGIGGGGAGPTGPEAARDRLNAALRRKLDALDRSAPRGLYLPLAASRDAARRVVRVAAEESSVLLTPYKVHYLLVLEVEEFAPAPPASSQAAAAAASPPTTEAGVGVGGVSSMGLPAIHGAPSGAGGDCRHRRIEGLERVFYARDAWDEPSSPSTQKAPSSPAAAAAVGHDSDGCGGRAADGPQPPAYISAEPFRRDVEAPSLTCGGGAAVSAGAAVASGAGSAAMLGGAGLEDSFVVVAEDAAASMLWLPMGRPAPAAAAHPESNTAASTSPTRPVGDSGGPLRRLLGGRASPSDGASDSPRPAASGSATTTAPLVGMDILGEPWAAVEARLSERRRRRRRQHCGSGGGDDLGSRSGLRRRVVAATLVVKSHDDLRQDAFAALLLEEFAAVFRRERLPLPLRPYAVVATCADGGLLQTLVDARSIDAVCRSFAAARDTAATSGSPLAAGRAGDLGGGGGPGLGGAGCGGGGFADAFRWLFGASSEGLAAAREQFLRSMAAYSVFCYVLRIKDRHDGNILLCRDGSVAHVDFGIMLNVGFAKDIIEPKIKLSRDFVAVMADRFEAFRDLCVQGFLAIRKHSRQLLMVMEMFKMAGTGGAGLPCLEGDALAQLQQRLRLDASDADAARHMRTVVSESKSAAATQLLDRLHRFTHANVPT